ncbi:ArsR/SmtB family transcription factor [Pirellula sp. SH-Sr6A]|uniref:ArsR/SmtB family transcription factor n=1 Tax=Pirellula sp. SH-Sr6A TaxID=1632865 RepID=UPI001F0A960F|nr:metalloregulator ArsR/SmtB family transcription factor [Pirellula sp. SH-Sr6A]
MTNPSSQPPMPSVPGPVIAQNNRPVLSLKAWQHAAECLRVLAHPVRLQIVQLLLTERCTVGEIAERCGISPSQTSEHLKLLQRCGFLGCDKEARFAYYRVIEPELANIMCCIENKFQASAS